jgi:ABC-2 type transport system permease protein
MKSLAAELLVLRKRTSTWVLMGVWLLLALLFAYVLPYITLSGGGSGAFQTSLDALLPDSLAENLLAGFPFFGGVLALMLGVLAVGSDYGWDTLKTLFTQRPGRLHVFGAKLAAIATTLVPFVLIVFIGGATSSYLIANAENATVQWPAAADLLRAMGAGWLILSAWAAFGVLLAVLSRGTALAIGLGILYALVVEGLLSALASQVSWLDPLVEYSLRANGYSLVSALGVASDSLADNGPGAFSGPFVDGSQALVVLASYVAAFLLLSGAVFRRRDVT